MSDLLVDKPYETGEPEDFEHWFARKREQWLEYGPGSDEDVEDMIRHAYTMGRDGL